MIHGASDARAFSFYRACRWSILERTYGCTSRVRRARSCTAHMVFAQLPHPGQTVSRLP